MPGLAMMPVDGEALEVVPTPAGQVEIWRVTLRERTRLLSLVLREVDALVRALQTAAYRVTGQKDA